MIRGIEMVQTVQLLDALIRKTIDDIDPGAATLVQTEPSKPCPDGVIPALLWVLNRHEKEMINRGYYKES